MRGKVVFDLRATNSANDSSTRRRVASFARPRPSAGALACRDP